MKFFHLGDLHIGKTVNGFSMLEDQRHILQQVLAAIDSEKPDALVIAGDVYDKTVPSGAAMTLFDDFLTAVTSSEVPVLCISGNHDSPERLGFGSRIMESRAVHIAGVYDGEIKQVALQDEHGPVMFHLLPFVRPANVRAFYPDDKIENYADGIRAALAHNKLDTSERNVLVGHQFVLPAKGEIERSDSETEPVGSLYSAPSSLFDAYDYVALGHLHGPQQVGRPEVRYSGSPLKYSFSEVRQKKAITVVDMAAKDEVEISSIPLVPLRDMRKIRGPFAELVSPEVANQGNAADYLHITLTDEEEVIDAIGKLRRVYPNVMELSFDNSRTRAEMETTEAIDIESKSPMALFEEFFKEQNGKEMTEGQHGIVEPLLKDMGSKV